MANRLDIYLISDIVRIITQANAWNSSEPPTWNTRKVFIAQEINAGHELALCDRIQNISSINTPQYLCPRYTQSVQQILKHRHAVRKNGQDVTVPLEEIENEAIFTKNDLDILNKCYQKSCDKALHSGDSMATTVLGYHSLEVAGSLAQLQAELRDLFGDAVSVTVAEDSEVPDYFVDQSRYYDKTFRFARVCLPALQVVFNERR